MKISGNNQGQSIKSNLKSVEPRVEVETKYVDIVDKKNKLLTDAVEAKQISQNIAQTVEQLRKEQASQVNEKTAENKGTDQTKCYMPCYDEGPWFRENQGTEQTKCYMPCYDEGPWFREKEADKSFLKPPILCYRASSKDDAPTKGLPGSGGPLCYAPMKSDVKAFPGSGGPLCYAPMKSE